MAMGEVLDVDKCHIQCLAHIIHLAVMEVLIHIKAVKHVETEPNDIDLSVNLTEEEAEWIVSPENEKNTEKLENQ